MNRAQLAKYHCLKRDWAVARAKRNLPADQTALDALQVRSIGRAASSTTFTQSDLDKMVAAFLAEIKPADFNAQMQQQEQPFERRLKLSARIMAAGQTFVTFEAEHQAEWRVIAYVGGIQRSMGYEVRWPIADEGQLQKITGIMERRAAAVAKKTARVPAPALADMDCPY